MNGVVKFFAEAKGFGFIIGEDGKEYFVHKSNSLDNIKKDDIVLFDLEDNEKGPKCINVKRKKVQPVKIEENGK